MATQKIDFKKPLWMVHFLDTAVNKEKEKIQKSPVGSDYVPDQVAANGWGYVVVGYHLVEESFKALLYVRGTEVPMKHSLTILFKLLDKDDQNWLREYHIDFIATNDRYNGFPYATLDEFLENLDGDPNKKGDDFIGSFDWRYFLIENHQSSHMPVIGVELLHEIAYGATRIVNFVSNGNENPSQCTHSRRLRWERKEKLDDWVNFQANSGRWENLVDKLAILWGPDPRDRYDIVRFLINGNTRGYFGAKPKGSSLSFVDKRKEFENFDAVEAFQSFETGISRPTNA